MHRLAFHSVVVLILAGCSTGAPQSEYGNFIQTEPAVGKALAADVVKQMSTLYLPAKTRFKLRQPASDSFGTALIAGLRTRGYALQETEAKRGNSVPAAEPDKLAFLDLAYVLDQPAAGQMYRISVNIDQRVLSRAYIAKGQSVEPAGYWMKKD